jgi:superfamily II DNA or RNA helicase
MDTIHPGERPQGYSVSRYFYFVKTGKTHGTCRTCGKDTPWNEASMKYDQYCTNPDCKKAYVKMAKKRMIGKYGKVHLLNDPEQQKKMLAGRRISGTYKFPDGQKFEYVGQYEKNFLEMMDTLMNWHTNDIMAPSPHTYYYDYKNPKDKENEGEKFYIPDFYIPSLNLEIEIKQQTSTNEAMNAINRVKEKLKDEVMTSNPNINYLKLNDNNFAPFFEFIMKLKEDPETANESYMDLDFIKDEEVVDESYVFNKADILYNKAKFESGSTNLCFLTGHSGSGKSTMGNTFSSANTDRKSIWISLDWVLENKDYFSLEVMRTENALDMLYKFFTGVGKEFYVSAGDELAQYNETHPGIDYNETLVKEFIKFAIKYADSHKNQKFIIEGIQLFFYIEPEDLQDYAVYIKGTSMLVSWYRGFLRDYKWAKEDGKIVNLPDKIKWAFKYHKYKFMEIGDFEKKINKYRNFFEKKLHSTIVTESALKVDSDLITDMWNVNAKNGTKHTCVKVRDIPYTLRARSEILIIKNDEVFINFRRGGGYSLPGGTWDFGEDPMDAAIREAKEEIRAEVKDVEYCGYHIGRYNEVPEWVSENIPEGSRWEGYYNAVYIGNYSGNYTGFIKPEDRDDMITSGKFRKISDVYNILEPVHKEAINKFFNEPVIPNTSKVAIEETLHPACECFGSCCRLNDERRDCSGCEHGIVTESTIPDIKKIEKYYEKNGIKSGISNNGRWGLDSFESGKSDNLFILCNTDYQKIAKDLRAIISDDYTIDEDNYNTLFLRRKNKKATEKVANEATDWSSKNRYPVFIVLQHSGTAMSNMIKKFTRAEFSHACISFNSKLAPLYSFGNKKLDGKPDAGLMIQHQGPGDEFYKRYTNCTYSVYVMYVDKMAYNAMKARLQDFLNEKDKWKYDFVSLLKVFAGQASEKSPRYFCSGFVMDVVSSGKKLGRLPSQYKPEDILDETDISLVNHGTDFSRYNHKITEDNMRKVRHHDFDKVDVGDYKDPQAARHINDIKTENNNNEEKELKGEYFLPDVRTPKDLLHWMNAGIKYKSGNGHHLQDMKETYKIRTGDCHDQVEFERYFFKRFHLKYDRLFIIEYKDGHKSGGNTHSLLYFIMHRKFYWFENAWGGNQGIHGPYDDLSDLKDDVYKRWRFSNGCDKMIITTVKNVHPGMTLNEYVQACLSDVSDNPKGYTPKSEKATEAYLPAEFGDTGLTAMESIFGLFKSKEEVVSSWAKAIFGGEGLFGKASLGHFSGARLLDGKIEIRGINYTLLRSRIIRYYDDKSIYNIFLPKYNAMSYKRFERKKIQRSDIKIDYLYTEEFFALELVRLFTDLGKRFRDKNYKAMANTIYNNSWLAEADNKAEKTPLLDTSNLSNLSLTLNDYQKDFIEKYPKLKAQLNLNGYILAFEQGLGKTLTATGLSECLNVDHVYIVCPNSLKENWALEIQKYYKKYQEDEDLWRQEVFICSDKMIFFNENTTKFLIINNESIEKMYPYVMKGKNMLILDESHNFRNMNSKRVQQLLVLRDKLKCTDTLIMSGTPIKATPDEIVPALLMIDPTFTMEAAKIFTKAFKLHSALGTSLVQSRFGKIIYRKEKDVLEGKLPEKFIDVLPLTIADRDKYLMSNVREVVMQRFSEIYQDGIQEFKALEKPFLEYSRKYATSEVDYSRFKELIINMVKKDYELHEIDRIYVEDALKKIKANIRDKKERDYYDFLIKNYVRYKNHCLGVAFGEILPPYRRDMFISLYDENIGIIHKMIKENVKKTLIFTQFKPVANHIYQSLNDSGIGSVLITGDVKNRMEILKEFKENDSILVLVATSQTIGTGVTLTEANQMFFFGPPWRDSDFEQCSDRIHRIGQTDDCHIYTVTLDTGGALNLSTRMDAILAWSKTMTDAVIVTTDDKEDLDQTDFENLLKAQESAIVSEFLSIPEENQIEINEEIPTNAFDQYIYENESYMRRVYTCIKPIKKGTTIFHNAARYDSVSLIAKELLNSKDASPATVPNVLFKEFDNGGVKYWNLVASRDINIGEELRYCPNTPNEVASFENEEEKKNFIDTI